MEMVALQASARTKDATPHAIRKVGRVPGVVYGNIENTLVEIDERDLRKAYIKAGESSLVELEVEGKKVPVLFQSMDFHPVSSRMTHVDFYAVDMKKEVEAEVHIEFTGEAPAVKELGAILIHPLDAVLVRALPAKLPHSLPVDLSKLTEFGSTLTVGDLTVPEGVTILAELDETIAIAQEPREEKEEVPVAPVEGAEGATAEGAAAPAAEGADKAEAK